MQITFTTTFDTDTVDPNTLGEWLRQQFFPGDEVGCYSNFTPVEQADVLDENHLIELLDLAEVFDEDDWFQSRTEWLDDHYSFILDMEEYEVWMTCHWDGDGHLIFALVKDGDIVEVLQNTDCKKSYTWTWV